MQAGSMGRVSSWCHRASPVIVVGERGCHATTKRREWAEGVFSEFAPIPHIFLRLITRLDPQYSGNIFGAQRRLTRWAPITEVVQLIDFSWQTRSSGRRTLELRSSPAGTHALGSIRSAHRNVRSCEPCCARHGPRPMDGASPAGPYIVGDSRARGPIGARRVRALDDAYGTLLRVSAPPVRVSVLGHARSGHRSGWAPGGLLRRCSAFFSLSSRAQVQQRDPAG